MQETAKSARVFRFGVFEVDAATGELRKQGLRIRMQEQPAQFLLILLDRAGEVVSREEIRRKLWPPDTFVDFDQGLGASLRKLRQALGDDAETPRYIETIPKQGFRFVAPVERISAPPQGETAVLAIRAIVPPAPEAHREFPENGQAADANLPAYNEISSGITGQTQLRHSEAPIGKRNHQRSEARGAAAAMDPVGCRSGPPPSVCLAGFRALDKTAVAAATIVPSLYTAAPIHILCSLQSCNFAGRTARCLCSRGARRRNGAVG